MNENDINGKSNRENLLCLMLGSLLFFPQLPVIFQRSELHINVLSLFLMLLTVLIYRVKGSRAVYLLPFSYFIPFQVFLFISVWFGPEGLESFAEIPSYFRPTMLLLVTLGFLCLINDITALYNSLVKFAKVFVVIVFFYSVCEVFLFDIFSGIMFIFYRLEDKSNIDGVAVSFFTLPYYGSYILCTLLPLLLSNFRLNGGVSVVYVLLLVFSVVLTQSKMGVFLCLGIMFLYWFISVKTIKKVFILVLFCFLLLIMYFFLQAAVAYLNDTIGGNFARTLHLILSNTEHAHNLLERLKDITETYTAIVNYNPWVGIGLGKGETIEIWVGSVMYRYGIIGLLYFILFYLTIALVAMFKASKRDYYSVEHVELLKFVSVWSFSIFISQLSGLMIEMSKGAVISCMMIAIAAKTLVMKTESNSKKGQ